MSDDATIGVPKADSFGGHEPQSSRVDERSSVITETRDRDSDQPAVASVHVAALTEWDEARLAAGEAMEVTVPTQDGGVTPVAYVEVDEDVCGCECDECGAGAADAADE